MIAAALLAAAAPGRPVGDTRVTVAVMRVVGEQRSPVVGASVRLDLPGGGDDWLGSTGDDGTVTFDSVPVLPKGRVAAITTHEGVRYESQPEALSPDVPAGLVLEVFARSGDPGKLRVARLLTEVFLREGQLRVEQTWRLSNSGDATWDPAAGGGRTAGLEVHAPEGAVGLRSPDDPSRVAIDGTTARYVGVVRPGPWRAEDVRVAWLLPYEASSARFFQTSDLPIDDAVTALPEVPVVGGRRLDGVRLAVGRHAHEGWRQRELAGGATFLVGHGLVRPGTRSFELEVMGLPHRSLTDVWVAVSLAILALGWALARLFGPRPARGGEEQRRSTLDPLRADLGAERERLFGELLRLERRGAPGPTERARRGELVHVLADLDRRMELL